MNEITAKDAYSITSNYLKSVIIDLKPVFDKIREKAGQGCVKIYIEQNKDSYLYNSVCSVHKIEYLRSLGYYVKNNLFSKNIEINWSQND